MAVNAESFVTIGHSRPMRVREPEAVIAEVVPGSIADQLGLTAGDRLRRINGQPPRDIIDYQLWTLTEELDLLVELHSGEEVLFELVKDEHEDLGITFENILFVPLRTCNNGCLFCFVLQAPPGMRPTVYIKDDDYRLSFLGGHFTTLTNLTEPHFERIVHQRLSPMYVSVHASEPALRRLLLDNLKADVGWHYLVRLIAEGIECHTQIVLCPGVNDGEHLDRTITDLAALGPLISSIGVVPVGLTQYQQHPLMRPLSPAEAAATIDQVEHWRAALAREDSRLVYAADELYLESGQPLPDADYYDDFAQVENGVGQTRLFLDAFDELTARLPARVAPRQVTIVTGGYGGLLWPELLARLRRVEGLDPRLAVVENRLFGGNVQCSGLLCGADIIAQVPRQPAGALTILPGRALNENGLLLDNLDLAAVAAAVGGEVTAALTPGDLLAACGLVGSRA
ncbi:MAG: DUF512 domain-containing protein [Armatimonadetes bacterium]|nr:DUF512 domain-containing protein [Armatimonadota bacterium]